MKQDKFLNIDGNKIIFNIISDINLLNDNDKVVVLFGIENESFHAKVNDTLFTKSELLNFYNSLCDTNISKTKDFEFINPTLRFELYIDGNYKCLNIFFEFKNNCDYYVTSIEENDILKLYNLLREQM